MFNARNFYCALAMAALASFRPHGLFSQSTAHRYISLAPSTTEILFALGLDNEIAAVSVSCDYPAAAKTKEKIGTFSAPNLEKIVSLHPDIVFTTGLEQTPWVKRLRGLGLKVIVSDPRNIRELMDSIEEIGEATAKKREAAELTGAIKVKLLALKKKTDTILPQERPLVYIEIWHDPLMTAGPGSFIDELLALAGARNIAFDAPRAYSRFSAETIIVRNPDTVVLGYMTDRDSKNAVGSRLGWQSLRAVKRRRIITTIDPNLLLRPGPRIIEGLEELYRQLYHE